MKQYEQELLNHLDLRGLTQGTKKNYLYYLRGYINHFSLEPCSLTIEHIKKYLYTILIGFRITQFLIRCIRVPIKDANSSL